MNGLSYTLEELLDMMKRFKVQKGLLLSPPMNDGTILANEEIINLCGRSKGLLHPVITVEPSPREVRRAIKLAKENRGLVKAFKVRLGYVNASAGSRVYNQLYDFAESENLPALFHTGDTAVGTGALAKSHPLSLDELANKRGALKIVLCHFGNPWFMDTAELVYKHENVYTDISGLITGSGSYAEEYAEWLAGNISEAIYYIGDAGKVFFGTDYPVTKQSDALALVKSLEISQSDKERILLKNAERVFQL